MNARAASLQIGHALRALPRRSLSARIADVAERSLRLEVETWPKPGLVSHVDAGSHDDMDAGTFRRSALAIRPFFAELIDAGVANADMSQLRRIGLRAERAMLRATGGVNTHRGAIFGMGLLCAAAGLRDAGHVAADASLGEAVSMRWGNDILAGPRLASSHGEVVGRRYGVGGARQEAASGFPCIYDVALPALRSAASLRPNDAEAARVQACFALVAVLDDTNLLHRGGADGLRFAQRTAQAFMDRGGVARADWRAAAESIHRAFVERHLSPGGAADLLAMSVFALDMDEGVTR